MLFAQFGESANELVKKWGNSGYRYGFPDQYAAEFPVRPMNYDQSRIYSGIIGRHYPDAETERYHYSYDPNMYLQPGFGAAGGMSTQEAINTLEWFLSVLPSPSSFANYDVVFDTDTSRGTGIDALNKLFVIHGGSLGDLQLAIAAAGGVIAAQTPDSDLAKRIARSRSLDPTIRDSTFGKLDDVRHAVENMIAVLKSGAAQPIAPTPITIMTASAAAPGFKLTRNAKIAIAGGTALLAVGTLTAVLLTRRGRARHARGY